MRIARTFFRYCFLLQEKNVQETRTFLRYCFLQCIAMYTGLTERIMTGGEGGSNNERSES